VTIALTGATGFVGQATLEEAVARGARVKALARRDRKPREAVEWVRGALEDEGALDALARGARAMLHIAGLTKGFRAEEFEAANVEGTARVIAACKRHGVARLVLVSSLAAREPSLSAYGASKRRAEELVRSSGLDWTILRPPAVYGPRDRDMFELFRAARWGVVPLPPGGATSIIHVDDLARLLLALVDWGVDPQARAAWRASLHQLYEPDDGREGGWSHKELACAIARAIGRSRVLAPRLPRGALNLAARLDSLVRGDQARLTPDRVAYMCHPNWVVRFDRRVPEALWTPRIDGDTGLKQTAQWYREAGWL